MAEIMRVTVGKRKRIVTDGRDDTLYYEVEAHYQPGELPMDSDDPTRNAGMMMALTSLSVLIDNTVDAEVGAEAAREMPAVRKLNGQKAAPKMATPKQLGYIEDLAMDPALDKKLEGWLIAAGVTKLDSLTSVQADQLIKFLNGASQ